VEFSTLKEDLFRRDVTINAMAMSISQNDFGRIIDFFGGQKDLSDKKIRILHDASFIDDPTRILRAIRFEQRFDFKVESRTEQLLKEALEKNLLAAVGKWRLNKELALISKEKDHEKVFRRMKELGVNTDGH
jgi:tRNA nucleotidyltransferase (CCA-adding enzyme)